MAKGLSATERLAMRATPVAAETSRAVEISLSKIRFDPTQPRKAFHRVDGQVATTDAEAVAELSQSIERQGLIQPITVEAREDGTYLVLVGERRTRAHLLLGKATITAFVRNDLSNRKRRLVFQLAENIDREDLTDADLAESIMDLKQGVDGEEPMTQVQIAKELGKSEGWVSRFVRFSNDEQQRLWVKTGIAETVENVYRLSLLPMPFQAEIQRRVNLPEDHPEHLAKPLSWSTIEEFKKRAAQAARATFAAPASAPAAHSAGRPDGVPLEPALALPPRSDKPTAGHPTDDPVGAEFAAMAVAGRSSEPELSSQGEQANPVPAPAPSPAAAPAKAAAAPGGYALPDDARSQILGGAGVTLAAQTGAVAQPPIKLTVPLAKVAKLLELLPPELYEAIVRVQTSITLPMPLAEEVASYIAGVRVGPAEVSTVLQNEAAKLV